MSGPSQTERMKANREHGVSLSPAAGSLLETARRLRNWSDLVFPSPRAKPLSDLTLSKLLKEQCIQPCATASGREFGSDRPRRRTTRGRSSRPRSRLGSRTRSRLRTRGRPLRAPPLAIGRLGCASPWSTICLEPRSRFGALPAVDLEVFGPTLAGGWLTHAGSADGAIEVD